ncbi:DUF456 domain-containing protein [Desulfovibrio ferrophilus]|uniref:DUF456 domain-containing protein n=1 Tax=Desulfovibrio ferrophilus TaxID=241368 RepID=A0A2Z6AXG7_9BACT|nr:DUF456 domain-containing protein [Desulfovibrio ferrophilus]BBD07947.1 uncharacterized protein DFE_1221 [Desulfovibrio ferrophilus]
MDFGQIWAGLYIIICFGVLGLHIFSLPANWVLLALVAGWKAMHPEMPLTWMWFGGLAGLAVIAEVLEFVIQLKGSKKYGASGKGNIGGIIGAIAGAIIGAGFLFGIGALPGALLGAYGGCLLVETLMGRSFDEARAAAWGAMWGKFFGLTVKAGMGGVILSICVPAIWS